MAIRSGVTWNRSIRRSCAPRYRIRGWVRLWSAWPPMRRCCRTNARASHKRASLGLARTGGGNEDHSGDIFIAFATGNDHIQPAAYEGKGASTCDNLRMVNNDHISELFLAATEAVEEAIINALLTSIQHRRQRACGAGAGCGNLARIPRKSRLARLPVIPRGQVNIWLPRSCAVCRCSAGSCTSESSSNFELTTCAPL
jgi:hypothetical protein